MNRPLRRSVVRALIVGSFTGFAGCNTLHDVASDFTSESTARNGLPTESATLVPRDHDPGDRFGTSVALADGSALVGTPQDEDPNGSMGGAAYVFEEATGGWRQQAKLAAPDGDAFDRFGSSVALADDTALVGASGADDPNGENAGAVYVFDRTGDGWESGAKLAADDGDTADTFGASLAFANDTAVVGAPTDEDPNGIDAGTTYVFERSGDRWSQRGTLAPADGAEHDAFGTTVALAGDTAVVGAPGPGSSPEANPGSAYVFDRTNDGWTRRATLAPDDGNAGDKFGTGVGIADGIVLIGAPQDEDSNGEIGGSAYVFSRSNGEWTREATIRPADGDARDRFGRAITVTGDTALISAKGADDPNGEGAGAAYLFDRTNGGLTRRAKLAPGGGKPGDRFGWAVALAGGTAVGTAPRADAPNGRANNGGVAYVFER